MLLKRIHRRDFLKISGASLAVTALATLPGCRSAVARQTVPLGVQLYSVRHELERDFDGTLARLAEMGFEGVEFADYYGRSAEELRASLDAHGLRCCGTHIFIEDMWPESLEETVAFNRTLGNEYLIVRWLDEEMRDSRETFMETVGMFNQIASDLEPHGMRVGYHNHDYIFETFDGEMLWDILAENTRPDVMLQLDTGHAARFGLDPVDLINRHPGRTVTMHAKPYSATNEAAFLGEDELDWQGIVSAAEDTGGVEWYILEYEVEGIDPLEALEASVNAFRPIARP